MGPGTSMNWGTPYYTPWEGTELPYLPVSLSLPKALRAPSGLLSADSHSQLALLTISVHLSACPLCLWLSKKQKNIHLFPEKPLSSPPFCLPDSKCKGRAAAPLWARNRAKEEKYSHPLLRGWIVFPRGRLTLFFKIMGRSVFELWHDERTGKGPGERKVKGLGEGKACLLC